MKEILFALEAGLKAKGCPLKVEYGPTQVKLGVGPSRIVLQTAGNDQMGPARSQRQNPKQRAICAASFVVWIEAKSTKANAQRYDHEALARQAHEAAFIVLDNFFRFTSKTEWHPGAPSFVVREDAPEGWAGVVYQWPFTVDLGIEDVTWKGDAAAEMTMGADTTANTPAVSGPAASKDLPTATTRAS